MSTKLSKPPPDPYYFSPEECQEMFGGFTSRSWQVDIPEHHKKILEERIADYCKNGMQGTPWEEFEKELFELLMKG